MPAIFFALISYLGWGVGDVFTTLVTRKIGAYSTSFWFALGMLVVSIFYAPFGIGNLNNLTVNILILNLLLGTLLAIAALCFNQALKIGNPSLVGTIGAAFSALVVVFSIIFLGEIITGKQLLSMVLIFIGIVLSSLDLKALTKRENIVNRGVILALAAMFLWGIYFTFIKIPIREIGWFWPSFISGVSSVVLLSTLGFKGMKLIRPSTGKTLFYLILTIATVKTAELSFNYAISQGLTSVVAPIAGSYPTLFVLLAFLIFKDPITRQQIAGIIATLIGIVLLSYFSI